MESKLGLLGTLPAQEIAQAAAGGLLAELASVHGSQQASRTLQLLESAALYREGRTDEVLSRLASIPDGTLERFDRADLQFSFSEPVSGAILRHLRERARLRLLVNDREGFLQHFPNFLESCDELSLLIDEKEKVHSFLSADFDDDDVLEEFETLGGAYSYPSFAVARFLHHAGIPTISEDLGRPLVDLAKQLRSLEPHERISQAGRLQELAGYEVYGDYVDLYFSRQNIFVARVNTRTATIERLLNPEMTHEHYLDRCRSAIEKQTGVQVVCVLVRPDGNYVVERRESSILIDKESLRSLRSTGSIKDSDSLAGLLSEVQEDGRPLVLWSTPFSNKAGRHLTAVEEFASTLSTKQNHPVLLDQENPALAEKAQSLLTFETMTSSREKSNLLAILDNRPSPVEDWGVISALDDQFEAANVRLERFTEGSSYEGPEGIGVIVVTGHSGPQLERLVESLGKGGYFRRNIVLFNSCATDLRPELVARINQDFGAVATFQHEGHPTAKQVEQLLSFIVAELQVDPNQNFSRLLNRALQSVGILGAWRICRLDRSATTVEAT